jgi:hypothetical protein
MAQEAIHPNPLSLSHHLSLPPPKNHVQMDYKQPKYLDQNPEPNPNPDPSPLPLPSQTPSCSPSMTPSCSPSLDWTPSPTPSPSPEPMPKPKCHSSRQTHASIDTSNNGMLMYNALQVIQDLQNEITKLQAMRLDTLALTITAPTVAPFACAHASLVQIVTMARIEKKHIHLYPKCSCTHIILFM